MAREEINGRIFRSGDDVEWSISDERMAEIKAGFAEFNRIRDAVPDEEQIHLRDRFGDEDKLGTPEEAQYLADVEERKKRGEYWG
ncbi:hypothetical protein ACW2Q0_30250 [Nocardia sp. R16R-3T]